MSYRPVEEATRKLRLKARNDLLHVDAFPTRPTNGWRILRCFVLIDLKLVPDFRYELERVLSVITY